MRGIAGLLLAVILVAPSPAPAQEKPTAKDSAAIQKCIKTKTARKWAWEQCIGIISEPCAKHEESMTPRQVIDCETREQAVWDDILNESYRRLQGALDEDQTGKLREMQRTWMTYRDKNCAFLYDYFQGTMANPMIAACTSRATGMQALYLLGFADDAGDRK
jgi:uncharacterized protein YecT (DUF1311 family)